MITDKGPAPIDAAAEAYLRPMIEKAAFAASANEAWLLLSCFALLAALLVPFAWKTNPQRPGKSG